MAETGSPFPREGYSGAKSAVESPSIPVPCYHSRQSEYGIRKPRFCESILQHLCNGHIKDQEELS